MNKRIDSLQAWLKENGQDACLVTSTENVFYLSGFRSFPHERLLGLFIFPDKAPLLIVPKMEVEDAKHSGYCDEILGYTDIENPWELIQRITGPLDRVAIEKTHLNVERLEALHHYLDVKETSNVEEKLQVLRMIKDQKELHILKEAAELADFAIEVGVSEISEGKTELDIIAAIEYELKKKGIREMSFQTMVLTGKNGASPHGTPGLTPISKGDLVLFDLGVVHKGYCSDITRTVAYGDISDEQKAIYDTVLQAELSALEKVRPGVSAKELDLTARNIINEAGYGNYFPHRLGHGLGVSVHEYPSLTETNPLLMEKGMVFTIEPGIYVPNVAGVRIEDDVVVTENGYETLTKFPKTLQVIS
ncbi:metallopeptidase [Bacillus coahuilensis m2-6]|uniref:M24 family metallopeptidase n=1 Tax=Bacillus coahuilensis TaxID=408580 RepID=UPI00075018F5|nr:Xaa-Pro peptidase family protein [Bacillus coahuilensis]KUP06669.1 metallopeptidase [Bacillus coahuilensis m2-6]